MMLFDLLPDTHFWKTADQFLWQSNAIEGEYSDEAFEDAKRAFIIALVEGDVDCAVILTIHRRLMRRLDPNIAGKIRTVPVYIGGERRDQSKVKIIKDLILLCEKNPTTEEDIKKWHVAFEKIHPFVDGNGRTGRILMNIQRLNAGLPLLIIHTGREQREYYKWFKDGKK